MGAGSIKRGKFGMKLFFIVVAFITADGEKLLIDGWYPLEVSTLERCEQGKERVDNYIKETFKFNDVIVDYSVTCEQVEVS